MTLVRKMVFEDVIRLLARVSLLMEWVLHLMIGGGEV